MGLSIFLATLLVAVLLAMVSIYSDLKARDRTPVAPPPGPQEGVWPPPPTDGADRGG